MKFYSDVTKKLYESQEDLIKAEKEIKDKENNRAKRAKEVETAISDAESAQKKANKLLNEFLKDYGSFHATIKTPKEESYTDIDSILNDLMRKILE